MPVECPPCLAILAGLRGLPVYQVKASEAWATLEGCRRLSAPSPYNPILTEDPLLYIDNPNFLQNN